MLFRSTCHKIMITLRVFCVFIHMNLVFCGVHYTKKEHTSQLFGVIHLNSFFLTRTPQIYTYSAIFSVFTR